MCWHKWSKWEQYIESGETKFTWQKEYYPFMEKRQKRHCIKCGYEQDEEV